MTLCKNGVCRKQANYNFKGNSKPLYCKEHSESGMVDVRHLKCLKCDKRPTYNVEGSVRGIYCKLHRENNMVDVRHKKCLKCAKRPTYNYTTDQEPIYCKQHMECDMINVVSIRCEECKELAYYNFKNLPPKYCLKHIKTDMVYVYKKACMSNFVTDGFLCLSKSLIKYDGYCTYCFSNKFPDDERTIGIKKKSKEISMISYLTLYFPDMYQNKPIWTSDCECPNRRRIDLYEVIDGTLLAVECDEYQHKNYNVKDELIRYNDIYCHFGGKMIFIRFNPDAYYDVSGVKLNPHIKTRLKMLKNEIDKQIDRIKRGENKEIVEISYMFYDEVIFI